MRMGNAARKTQSTDPKPRVTKKKATNKAPAKKSKSKSKRRKTTTTYLHLIIDYLADGISIVEKRVRAEGVKANVVRRAAAELVKSHPDNADIFVAWCEKNFPVSPQGREAPRAGQSRAYTAQQVKKGPPFLRLTLDVLGVKKSEQVMVDFAEDKLVVYKKVS